MAVALCSVSRDDRMVYFDVETQADKLTLLQDTESHRPQACVAGAFEDSR